MWESSHPIYIWSSCITDHIDFRSKNHFNRGKSRGNFHSHRSYLLFYIDSDFSLTHYNCHSSFTLIKNRLKQCFIYSLLSSSSLFKTFRRWNMCAILRNHVVVHADLLQRPESLVVNALRHILGAGRYRYVMGAVTFVVDRFWMNDTSSLQHIVL
jgi:hypothetical protein